MAKRILTLDIKANRIEWVLLRTGLRNAAIEKSGRIACRFEDTPPDTIKALQNLRESIAYSGLTCIAAIAGHDLFARSIEVPFSDRRKVRQILPLELEATLPVGVEDLNLDFKLTSFNDHQTALAAAMPRTRVELHLSILRQAGLHPELITFSGLPAAILLADGPLGKQASLLVDGDENHCTLFLIANHQLHGLRSWPPSDVDKEPARRLKSAVRQMIEAVYHDRPISDEIRTVYLTPQGDRHYPLGKIASELEHEVALFDPTQSAEDHLTGNLSGGHGQGALALGLYEPIADKGLNLFRSTFPLKRHLQQHRRQILRTAALAAILAGVCMVDLYSDIHRNRERTDSLRTEAKAILKDTFPETRNVVDPLQQMIVKLREARVDAMTTPLGGQFAKVDILRTISQSLPAELDIHVSQLIAGQERVQISGTTDTFEAVNEAQRHLQNAVIFHKISIISANMDQKANRVRFKLAADLQERT